MLQAALGETCDDGNTFERDGCDSGCIIESDLGDIRCVEMGI